MTMHRVCGINEVPSNALMPFAMGRGTVLLTRLPSGQIKAVGSRCPHQGANLEHGCVTGLPCSQPPNKLHMNKPGQILRVGLENDKDRVAYDLDVETAEPQFSMIGNRLPGGKVKFKTMPRAPKNLPWLVHVQLVRSIATGKSRHTSVFEVRALMRTARADGLDLPRWQPRQQNGAASHCKRHQGVARNLVDPTDPMHRHCAGASRPYNQAPFFQNIFSCRSSGNERGIDTLGSSKSK